VFELLVEETPDRGKEAKVVVDWNDPDQLRELIRRRVVFNGLPAEQSFREVWALLCVSHVYGEESSQFLLDRSLMRPRALIELINHCRSCAVNVGHTGIGPEDIRKGLSVYSTDLVREIGLEIRDALPEGEDALYAFIDVSSRLDEGQVRSLLEPLGLTGEKLNRLMEILLWYGVLGLVGEEGNVEYIYSVNYDIRLLKGRIRRAAERAPERAMFAINPAFWPGLGIREAGT